MLGREPEEQLEMFEAINLVQVTDLKAPEGLVYSTAPESAICCNEKQYVLKGRKNSDVVLSEAAAYSLCEHLKILTPSWKFIRTNDEEDRVLFGSEIIDGFRDIEPFLRGKKIRNYELIARVIVLDIWICNPDRNIGNFISRRCEPPSHGEVECVAIDFEKARTLSGPSPTIATGSTNPNDLWPSNLLGEILGRIEKPCTEWIDGLKELDDTKIESCLESVGRIATAPEPWVENTTRILCSRRDRIDELITTTWK